MERVMGIGGVFLKARDPKALAAWYRDHLGVPVDPGQTYGALTSSGPGEMTVSSTFPADTPYFDPGSGDVHGQRPGQGPGRYAGAARAADARVEDKVEAQEYGRFGWATDPEGNRFELWKPK